MDRIQEIAAIRIVLAEFDAQQADCSISDIAHLTDLPVGVVSEYLWWAGCRTELSHLRNRRSLLGYWEIDDLTN